MKFKDICSKGKCNVCGKEADIVVCASTMGACSFAYCEDCIDRGLEPYWAMVAYISCAGRFPEDINETYQKHCRRILQGLNITEEQFIKDVDKTINELYERGF